ncbi:hypothetical protein C8J56DRAFT_369461 [Mycena floridula]|nr:hypothetical protein C8J56DRAFT_369461 [Mycena floridula]
MRSFAVIALISVLASVYAAPVDVANIEMRAPDPITRALKREAVVARDNSHAAWKRANTKQADWRRANTKQADWRRANTKQADW